MESERRSWRSRPLLCGLVAGAMLWAACGDGNDDDAPPATQSPGALVAETPTRTPARPTETPTPTPTRPIQAVEATPTPTASQTSATVWDGTYDGTVTWDCGGGSTREGTLAGEYVITVDGTVATLEGENTVIGSCAGTGTLTTGISVTGERTAEGFEFPAELWGRDGVLSIEVSGSEGSGRLEGPIPGPAVLSLTFEVRAR